ncbi:MAG: BamA/TamA family outer membrane protein, partial [Deltaproteobacteria bacterium]|nr:BamA/TamA family outer membrane protein [Deltaproteobacteria bacterium]
MCSATRRVLRPAMLCVGALLVMARSAGAAPDVPAASPEAAAPAPPAPEDPPADAPPLIEPPEPITDETAEQGPLVFIESIDVRGNTATQTELILRALTVAPGDVLHSGDKRLRELRFKILALGFFLDVTVAMRKGSARGQVIVEIAVVERGTIVLNRLWFGSNALSPYWIGADVGERNLLGLGVAVGAGIIYADNGGIDGARPQWAGEVRAADSSLFGTRLGINGSVTLVRGSEAYRISGIDNDTEDRDFAAFQYRRFGGRGALTYDLNALTRISAGMRGEVIDATLPSAPTRELPDGQVTAIDLHLEPNHSRVATLGFTIDRDTRPDPTLPHSGGRVLASFELASSLYGSSYDFASVFGRFEHWWPLRQERHTIGVRLAGGVIVGNAPRFDRIHVSDV